ncbi:MAG: hypothetical protein HY327_00840 [Chloroflexi bacterium]|nr:hypothetical protein [Chloroflexota bacterium]
MADSMELWNHVGSTDADAEYLYGLLLERGAPMMLRDLAEQLIAKRLQEQAQVQAQVEARRAQRYQPKETYAAGDRLYFPALNNVTGVVKKTRAGDNPRYGEFQVLVVQLEGEAKPREFAAAFAHAHSLNQEPSAETVAAMTPAHALQQFGAGLIANLRRRLGADKEFVLIGDQCFLRELLTEIPDGYLNIAEAAIESAADALPTIELVNVLQLPPNVKKTGVTFSLASALAHDARFEDVGPAGKVLWYLTRLEPPEAREQPAILEMLAEPVTALSPELETIASDLFQESNAGARENKAEPFQELTLVLTYPHRRAGTFPLFPSVRALLPPFAHPRLKVTFVDAATQEKFAGIAVADGNYLAGLSQWYNTRHLQPGAYVTLRRHAKALTIEMDFQPQRERSLWMRVAKTVNGQLTFAQERRPLAFKCDEEMLIGVGDPVGIDAAAEKLRRAYPHLDALLEYVFPELAKLSGAGRVHAKTLYSAVNFVRRAGLRAVMSALSKSHAFTSAGGGYFVLNERSAN